MTHRCWLTTGPPQLHPPLSTIARNYSGTVLSFENGKLVEIRQDLKDN
jgi:hypothetical protein